MSVFKDANFIVSIFNVFSEGSAVIAGGAVRDMQVGRTPKDVDIIIRYEDDKDIAEGRILADRLGYSVTRYNHYVYNPDTDYQLESNPSSEFLHCVLKLESGDKEIDLIFVKTDPIEHIKKFPANSSMVWLDNGEVKYLPPFNDFMLSNTIYVLNPYEEYAERMSKYFPEHKILFVDKI